MILIYSGKQLNYLRKTNITPHRICAIIYDRAYSRYSTPNERDEYNIESSQQPTLQQGSKTVDIW
ncbi:MAG: hypothetical protein BroJett002_00010 [Candidatus Brocadia sinica]|nr:MAG: hypothetical protein BroJett002_00010 [Candidatus Brocadia sinica]